MIGLFFVDDDDYLKNGHKKVLSKSQDFDVVILRMKQGENIIPRYDNRVIESGNVGINFALKSQFYLKHKFLFDNNGHEEDWRFLTKVFSKTKKNKSNRQYILYCTYNTTFKKKNMTDFNKHISKVPIEKKKMYFQLPQDFQQFVDKKDKLDTSLEKTKKRLEEQLETRKNICKYT